MSEVRLLFVTWDGPQVTYLESLFVPIFAGLRSAGIHTDILQFRWGTPAQEDAVRAACEAQGCRYRAIPITRSLGPLGPFLTALAGSRKVTAAAAEFGSSLLMPRSLMPAIAVQGSSLARRLPILFDADGFAADERVDTGSLSRHSPIYRLLRLSETRMARQADGVLVRSEAAARIIAERAGIAASRVQLVGNGRNEQLFSPVSEEQRRQVRAELGIAERAPLLVYSGSIGPQYRFDRMLALFGKIRERRPDARWLILTGSPGDVAREVGSHPLRQELILRRVQPEDVPAFLGAADVGLAFRARSFSTQAIAPIKLGEYLLCGLPVIGTAGIGTTGPADEAGVFFDEGLGLDEAADWFIRLGPHEDRSAAARAVGIAHFSLSRSVDQYRSAIQRVLRGRMR